MNPTTISSHKGLNITDNTTLCSCAQIAPTPWWKCLFFTEAINCLFFVTYDSNWLIINKLCWRLTQYVPTPASWPIDLESGVRVTCDVGFLCTNFSLPKSLLLISKTATLHAYIRQNVDIILVSSFNAITVVVFHLRNKNTFTTDIFYVRYRCCCTLLLSAIYE